MHDGKADSFISCDQILCQSFPHNRSMILSAVSFCVAMCIEGVGGLTWIFSTALVLSIFSMIMIMFRAALYPVKLNSIPQAANGNDLEMEVVEYNKALDEHADTAEPVIY